MSYDCPILRIAVAAILLVSAVSGWSAEETTQPQPPYVSFAEGNSARIAGKGIVSTELPEFATSFSPDGKTVYFNRMPADRSKIQIWSSEFVDGEWSEAAPLPFSDGRFRDVDPFVSPDGERLYFSSTRPLDGEEPGDYDIWYVERMESGWGDPINPGAPLNSSQGEIYSTVSADGYIYFSIFGDDGASVYRSRSEDGGFREPEPVEIGTESLALGNPTVSPDGSFLLLVSDHEGQADIYISRRQADGAWADVEALKPTVNSAFTDFAPHISPDGSTLFFTSERPGVLPEGSVEGRPPGDIYAISLDAALP